MKSGTRRPKTSDMGPNTIGPDKALHGAESVTGLLVMKETEHTGTKSTTPSVAATRLTWNLRCIWPTLTLRMELVKVTAKTMSPIETIIAHIRLSVQSFGQPGLLGPSKSARKGSVGVGASFRSCSEPLSRFCIASPGLQGCSKLLRDMSARPSRSVNAWRES